MNDTKFLVYTYNAVCSDTVYFFDSYSTRKYYQWKKKVTERGYIYGKENNYGLWQQLEDTVREKFLIFFILVSIILNFIFV